MTSFEGLSVAEDFLTGARGLELGSYVASYCEQNGIELIVFDRERYLSRFGEPIDIQGADVIIHCSANTDVEKCERHPVAAYHDNTLLTDLLVRSAYECGAKFVYISSTGIYGDGSKDHMMNWKFHHLRVRITYQSTLVK